MKSDSEVVYNSFSSAKKQQKYIWISSMVFLAVAFISVLVFLYYQSQNVVVIKENGQEVTAAMKSREETFKAQSYKFLEDTFYYTNSFDRFTRDLNMSKTLFHMDAKSADRIFAEYERSGAYADALSKGAVYKAQILPETIKIMGNAEPFKVEFQGIIEINDGGFITKYITLCQGDMIYYTPHYPEKPTGFFLNNYRQKSKVYEQEQ